MIDFCNVDRDDPDLDEKMDTYKTYVDMVAGAEHDVAALIAILKEAEVNEMLEQTIGDIHCSIGDHLSRLGVDVDDGDWVEKLVALDDDGVKALIANIRTRCLRKPELSMPATATR